MLRLIKMLKPYKRTLILSLVFVTLSTVLQLIVPMISKNLMSAILSITPDEGFSGGFLAGMPSELYKYAIIVVACSLVSLAMSLLNNYYSTVTSTEYAKALRSMMFTKISSLSQSDIDRVGVSSLITRTTNDISNVHEMILSSLKSVLGVPIMLIGGLVMVFKTAPTLASTILLMLPIFALVLIVFFKFVVPMFSKMQKKLDELNQILREKISGIRVIRAFNKSEYEDKRFTDTNFTLTSYSLKANRIMACLLPIATMLAYGIIVLLLYRVVKNVNTLDPTIASEYTTIKDTIPNLSAFLMYFMMIITAIASIISIVGSYPRASISAKRINVVLDIDTDVKEAEHPTPVTAHDGTVEFCDVGFKYKESIPDDKTPPTKAGRRLAKLMGMDDDDDKKKKGKPGKKDKPAGDDAAPAAAEPAEAEAGKPAAPVTPPADDSDVSDEAAPAPVSAGPSLTKLGTGKSANDFGNESPYTVKKDIDDEIGAESQAALEHISFKSGAGQITAIIGGTGCGKSTVISLIPRLYDATEGEILIDGVPIKEISFNDLQKRIAYIPQKAFLFSGTIRDNIRFGKEDATDEEIWKALEIAQAKSFVASMPDGLDSMVSQAGNNFSGGQKQRLAIARAIIKDAEICIFDDSFSALDLATDARLRAAIRDNLTNTDIIIVAQRVGTVMDADRIIVMDAGRIVGMGKHDYLLENCSQYRDIVASQLRDSEEAC